MSTEGSRILNEVLALPVHERPNWWNEFSIVSGRRRTKKGWRGGRLRRNRALTQLSVGNLKQYQEKNLSPTGVNGEREKTSNEANPTATEVYSRIQAVEMSLQT